MPLGRLALVLVAVKLAVGAPLLLGRGFVADYYANDQWRAPRERSVDFLALPATRIDGRLQFGPRQPFPLFFFNDNSRFNFYGAGQPDRQQLGFSVIWRGFLRAPRVSAARFYLAARPSADGARGDASLAVDGRPLVGLDRASARAEGETPLAPGWHSIEIRYANPYGAARVFAAGIVRDGRDRPLGADTAYLQPAAQWRVRTDRVVRALSWMTDAIVLALLLGWAALKVLELVRAAMRSIRGDGVGPLAGRMAFGAVAVAVIAVVLIRAHALAGFPAYLSGGDDWLTHETLARDIALNGPLMTRGLPVGQAAPFSTQPLYPYFLALVHLVAGEDFWGVYVAQRLLFAAMIWAVFRFTGKLFGRPAGWLAGGLAGLFVSTISLNQAPLRIAESLLGETLLLPLLAFWVLLLARLRAAPVARRWTAVLAGVLGGLAVLTRSPLLLAVPLVAILVARDWRGRWGRGSRMTLAIFLGALAAVVGLATLRNVIASGHWVLVSSAGPINLYLGNEPPPGVDVSRAGTRAIYRGLGLDPMVAKVAEYVIQAPASFARRLGWRALYALGVTEWGREPQLLAAIWMSAATGVILLLARWPERADPLRFVPAVIAVAYLAVIVVVGNFTYRYRLVHPAYLMLVPYSAYAASLGWRALRGRLVRMH